MTDFHGYPIRRLSSGPLELDCLATAGPRIVGLRYKGSGNLLAEVPQVSVQTPYGEYRYLGGHRLWHSPESMPRTYVPDLEGLNIIELPDGVLLDGRVEGPTGIHKRLEIHLHPDGSRATLTHTLINEGLWEANLAPWVITMFRLGGAAVLPIFAPGPIANELLPNRHFALWPYTRVRDPRLQIEDQFILVRAKTDLPPFKVGSFNPRGWIAYWTGEVLFRKILDVVAQSGYPDFECNSEIYCDSHFIELESLAPLTRLAPGASVSHVETWELYDKLEQEFLSDEMIRLLQQKAG